MYVRISNRFGYLSDVDSPAVSVLPTRRSIAQLSAHLFNDLAVPCQVGASAVEGVHSSGELIKGWHTRQCETTAVSAVAVER